LKDNGYLVSRIQCREKEAWALDLACVDCSTAKRKRVYPPGTAQAFLESNLLHHLPNFGNVAGQIFLHGQA
jgi:hypothetical protein